MAFYLDLLLYLAIPFSFWNVQASDGPKNPPLYLSLKEEFEEIKQVEEVFSFQGKDTTLEHQVMLLSNEKGEPLLFYSDILTPVCIDNVCKPMYIEVYWNLVGAYTGYGVFKDNLLSKYDHDLFEEADYLKLHHLLKDENSILKRKELSDLFDINVVTAQKEKVKFKGKEVDAVSGATKKEIKESVVEGALYSCYTIWHLVHGEVTKKIENYLLAIYSKQVEQELLFSNHEDYQFFALKKMAKSDFESNLNRVIQIFKSARPLVRTYILKKIPNHLLEGENISRELYTNFSEVDINTKTLLINKLEFAHNIVPGLLATQVKSMSRNQVKTFLAFLFQDEKRMTDSIRKCLTEAANSKEFAFSYIISQFLD